MDHERTAAPPPDGTGPRPGRRGTALTILAAVAGAGIAVTAAVLAPSVLADAAGSVAGTEAGPGTTTPAPGREAPTAVPDQDAQDAQDAWATDVQAGLRSLPGVADAEVDARTGVARITLDTPLPSPDEAQGAMDDARAALAASPRADVWSLTVAGSTTGGAQLQVVDGAAERRSRGTDPATGATLPDLLGDDPAADAVRILGDGAVRAVSLFPDHASAEVRTPADLVPVAGLVRGEGRGLSSLVVTGYGTGSFGGDGSTVPDDALLALLADAAARPGVTQVAHEARRDGYPGTPLLTVMTSGPPEQEARWLTSVAWSATPLPFQVHGVATDGYTGSTGSGHVGGVRPDAVPAPADACATSDLVLAADGFDAAAGRRFLRLTAHNHGAGPCTLVGTPALRFLADDGGESDVLVEPDPVAPAATPVTLAPGEGAQTVLSWRGGPTADDPPRVVAVLVTPVPGGGEGAVTLGEVPGAESGLDLLDGATAVLAPWSPWVALGPA